MKIHLPQLSAPVPLLISYMTLRKMVGLLGMSLVPVLILGSFLLDHTTLIQISVSAYYHTSMRDLYTGIICGMGIFLLSYRGYNWQDSLASKLAGLFAWGIALFPTSPSTEKADLSSKLHYITAGLFFAMLSYMSIFLFTKSAGIMTPEKKKRNRLYRVCGVIMLVSVMGIPVGSIPVIHDRITFMKPTLILESFALISFGLSWLTKGEFLLKDK